MPSKPLLVNHLEGLQASRGETLRARYGRGFQLDPNMWYFAVDLATSFAIIGVKERPNHGNNTTFTCSYPKRRINILCHQHGSRAHLIRPQPSVTTPFLRSQK